MKLKMTINELTLKANRAGDLDREVQYLKEEKKHLLHVINDLKADISSKEIAFADVKNASEALGNAENMLILMRHRVEELSKENNKLKTEKKNFGIQMGRLKNDN